MAQTEMTAESNIHSTARDKFKSAMQQDSGIVSESNQRTSKSMKFDVTISRSMDQGQLSTLIDLGYDATLASAFLEDFDHDAAKALLRSRIHDRGKARSLNQRYLCLYPESSANEGKDVILSVMPSRH